jgi:hypothetical protein
VREQVEARQQPGGQTGPEADLDGLAQLAAGVGEVPGAQVKVGHEQYRRRLDGQVTGLAGPGQAVREAAAGGRQVAGLEQELDDERPGEPHGPAEFAGGEDPLRLPGPVQRVGRVPGVVSGAAELGQGEDLPGRIAGLAGHF